jgi:hypothetical protein
MWAVITCNMTLDVIAGLGKFGQTRSHPSRWFLRFRAVEEVEED